MELQKSKVEWRKGYRASGIDAAKAHAEVEKIRKANGGKLTPEAVVAKAKSPRNVLHKAFEWNDTTAGPLYRLEQARGMIRSFQIVYIDNGNRAPIRSYEIKREKKKDGTSRKVYQTIEDILSDPQSRAELISRLLRELVQMQGKYRAVQELSAVWDAVDRVLETVQV